MYIIPRNVKLVLVACIAVLSTACKKIPELEELEGLYKYSFPNMLMDGTEYQSENRLLLFQTAPNAFYFNTHIDAANGHSCDLSGIVERDLSAPQNLVYTAPSLDDKTCTFTIEIGFDELAFFDKDGVCRTTACGMRGMLEEVKFKYNTRESVSSDEIKQSEDFQRVTTEYFEAGN